MTKQKGFSAVIVLLSILVVTAVGFTGYYVWNSQQDKKADQQPEATITQPKSTDSKQTSSEAKNTQDAQKYFIIKDWSIKIPVESRYSDLTIKKYCDGGNCALIYSPTQISIAKEIGAVCAESDADNNIGSLVRFRNPNEKTMDTTFASVYPKAKEINGWYYAYSPPQGDTCRLKSPDNTKMNEYYNDFSNKINDYIQNIQQT